MALETGTYISDLTASNPAGGDNTSQGDDHLRLIKAVAQATFPNATKAFRFPTCAVEATGTVTVTFPDDQNKLFPVSASGAARTVNLPDPSSGGTVNEDGFGLWVIKTDSSANAVTIDASGAQTINGALTLALKKQYEMAYLVWNKLDAEWYAQVTRLYSPASTAPALPYTVVIGDDDSTLYLGTGALTLPVTFYAGFKLKVQRSAATSTTGLVITPSSGTVVGDPYSTSAVKLYGLYDSVELEWNGTLWIARVLRLDAEAVGTSKEWWLETAPSAKWVLMHTAQNLARTTYPELFALWSTNFGAGDGTTFGVPNRAGYFSRAWNNSGVIDPDAASRTDRGDGTTGDKVGSKQEDALDDHTHLSTFGSVTGGLGAGGMGFVTTSGSGFPKTSDGALSADVSTETRGKNIAVAYLLKVLP